ncbi:ankyrin repeat domain-containing protein [Treponema sp.]
MKVLILCAKADKKLVVNLLSTLKALKIRALAYAIRDGWEEENKGLDEYLAVASHVIVVYSKYSMASTWLVFSSGFCYGKSLPFILFKPSTLPAKPKYLKSFFTINSLEEIYSFFETERRDWTLHEARRLARHELLELGVSFKGDAFAETVAEGNIHAVELFLKAGFSADTRDKKGVPLLCIAARTGNKAILELLLAQGASPNLQSEDRDNTALMDAIAASHLGLVLLLLEAGTELNAQSKDGQTALIIAVGKNDCSTVRLLLEKGADPDIPDKLGLSARKYAKLFHNPEMTSLFP